MNTHHQPNFLVRLMNSNDVEEVMRIERASHSHPWTEKNLQDCLTTGYQCFVLEDETGIRAFAILMIAPGEAQILNIAVAPEHRRQGLARVLLAEMEQQAKHGGAEMLFLEVREHNMPARKLYDSSGFIEIGKRNGYYPLDSTHREDAIMMARQLLP